MALRQSLVISTVLTVWLDDTKCAKFCGGGFSGVFEHLQETLVADVLFNVAFLDALYFCVIFCIAFEAVHFCSKANELRGGYGASFGFHFAKDSVVFCEKRGCEG